MSAILSRPFVLMGAPYGGTSYFGNGSAAAPSIAFASDPTTGLYKGATTLNVSVSGALSLQIASNGQIYGGTVLNSLQLASTGAVNLTAAGTNQSITLTPSGTGSIIASSSILPSTSGKNLGGPGSTTRFAVTYTEFVSSGSAGPGLQIGTGTTAPITFNTGAGFTEQARMTDTGIWLFGTTTNSSNGRIQLATHTTSAGGIGFGATVALYQTAAGRLAFDHIGGTSPEIDFRENGTAAFTVTATAASVFLRARTGSLVLRSADVPALTLDTSQNATFAQSVLVSGEIRAGNTRAIYWAGRSALTSPSDGIITLSNLAQTDFSRLQFGGTTSAFPALKRSGASLACQLADDSNPASFTAKECVALGAAGAVGAGAVSYGGTTATTATAGAQTLPANPVGFIIVNVAGTTGKIPYYAN